MNRFIGLGRLVREPELKIIENSNNKYVNMTIAINREFKNKDGERVADFINITAFNKTAELINEYCKKGDKVGIEGRIQNNKV